MGDRAASLLEHEQYVEAIDLLEDARSRTADPELDNELAHRLAYANFAAGNFTAAANLFEAVCVHFTTQYGPGDSDAQAARYFLGQCRMELGDVTAATAAFENVAAIEPAEPQAVDRHLGALAALMRLYAVARR